MAKTVPQLMLECHDRDPDRIAFHWPEDGVWKAMTWREGLAEIARLARALHEQGGGHEVPVAILSDTRREWAALDLANLSLRGITVGIYPSLLAEQVAYQLNHSEARIVVVENAEQAAKIEQLRDQLPHLQRVLVLDPAPGHTRLDEVLPERPDVDWLREQVARVEADDVASLIYTSGTTGHPKGAILTHRNFVTVSEATRGIARTQPGERGLVFLPLAHSLQRFVVYRGLLEDAVAYYAESIAKLPEALAEARPTVLASVPRMLEKIHHKAVSTVQERGGVAQKVFDWAFSVGHERLRYVEARQPVPLRIRVKYRLADRVVFRKIRQRLGGELRVLVSGGAALNPAIARWYGAMGLIVLEGWGLTETSAPATCNLEDDFKFGTVGKALPGVEVKVADDGELWVRGPGVFVGYHKDEQATADVLTEDGWFKTGDIGTIDDDGFVRITDRKKEILVTAGGKNIAPVNIEKRIERSPYISQAVALGDDRPYLVALIVPDDEALQGLARREGWPDEPLEQRIERKGFRDIVEQAVDAANSELARYEQIKRYQVLPTTFTLESGELTPTLKLKRRVVNERYGDVIEGLYAAPRERKAG